MEGQVADLKRRIPILRRLIADCDHLAADLDQASETRSTASESMIPQMSLIRSTRKQLVRGDNLKRSANELRAHLAKAEKALLELGEVT